MRRSQKKKYNAMTRPFIRAHSTCLNWTCQKVLVLFNKIVCLCQAQHIAEDLQQLLPREEGKPVEKPAEAALRDRM